MDFLADNPVLLLFVVVAVGATIGRIELKGFSLGPAAVLFCGLAASGIDHRLVLDEDVQVLGLVLFTYMVGVSAGPAFLASLRGRGLRNVAAVVTMIVTAMLVVSGLGHWAGMQGSAIVGTFAGALTNTPALGAVLDHASAAGATHAAVGYSLAYPGGVLGALLAAHVALRGRRRRAAADDGHRPVDGREPLIAWTVRIEHPALPAIVELRSFGGGLAFGHCVRDDLVRVAADDFVPHPGDLLTVVGPETRLRAFADEVGERSESHAPLERRALDVRRVAVSSRRVAGRTLGQLDLPGRFGASATRVRRGDLDLLARDDLVLELGDRVRVVAPDREFRELAAYLGDSESRLAEIDFTSSALGLAAGAALGAITFPGDLRLGAAGGTLIAGLVLGGLGRVGPLHFGVGHQASLTLRQLGTVVFLAAVGTRAGAAFVDAAPTWTGARTVLIGLAVTAAAMSVVLVAGKRWCGLHGTALAGGIGGAQTQPAVLAFAQNHAPVGDQAAVGYTALYPSAMILKILAAQLLS